MWYGHNVWDFFAVHDPVVVRDRPFVRRYCTSMKNRLWKTLHHNHSLLKSAGFDTANCRLRWRRLSRSSRSRFLILLLLVDFKADWWETYILIQVVMWNALWSLPNVGLICFRVRAFSNFVTLEDAFAQIVYKPLFRVIVADDEILGLFFNFLVDLGLWCVISFASLRDDHFLDGTLADVRVSVSDTLEQRIQNSFLGTSLG